MKAHFVTFLSPGTFVHEETEKPIGLWDVHKASDMAHSITERHSATPFAFYFTTRERKDDELDSRQVKKSRNYFLGGEVFTLAQIKAKQDPKNAILISNMESNGYNRVVINTNSWRVAVPLAGDDIVLDWKPKNQTSK